LNTYSCLSQVVGLYCAFVLAALAAFHFIYGMRTQAYIDAGALPWLLFVISCTAHPLASFAVSQSSLYSHYQALS
jgi:hypothetical protein